MLKAPLKCNAWVILLCAASFFTYDFLQISIFNTLIPLLTEYYNTSTTTLGWVSAIYFCASTGLIIPAGLIVDRYPTRLVFLVSTFFSLLGASLFACATTLTQSILGRLIMGVSSGPFSFLVIISLAYQWFPPQKHAKVTGIIVAMGMLGGLLAQTPFTYLVTSYGWRNALLLNVLFGAVITLAIWLCVDGNPNYKKSLPSCNSKTQLLEVLTNSTNWLYASTAALINLPVFIIGALFGQSYLIKVHQCSSIAAAQISSYLYLGMLLGAPVVGQIAPRIKNLQILFLSGCCCCVVAQVILYSSANWQGSALSLLFFMLGFLASVHALAFPLIAACNSPENLASAQSIGSITIVGSGAIFQPIFAALIQFRQGAFDYAWGLLVILTFIATLMMLHLILQKKTNLTTVLKS